MKKMCLIFLAALCLLWPMSGYAQGLPAFLSAVQEGLSEGLATGAAQAALDSELTLAVAAESGRIEAGKTLTVTVTAGNPRPLPADVTLTLTLPERLAIGDAPVWEATLPAAARDAQTGKLIPSVTTFTREVTLMPGGESAQAVIGCEMNMGTRFYRASMPMELCVADVTAEARALGAKDGRLTPGDAMTYEITIDNAGTAAKDVTVDLLLPDGVALAGELPEGMRFEGGRVKGSVTAEAAAQDETGRTPSTAVVTLPAVIEADALANDGDAMRLLAGQLRVDGKRVPLPRVQVCGPKISARMLPEMDQLQAGEEMALRVVVVNAGLAEADVRLSCMLPGGLTLVEDEAAKALTAEAAPETTDAPDAQMKANAHDQPKDEAKDSAKDDAADEDEGAPAAVLPPDDGGTLEAAAVLTPEAEAGAKAVRQENGTLIFNLHMDAASETDGGVDASTQVLNLRVRADEPQQNLREQLVGATLAWSTDEGQTELGEAVAVRVYRPMFLGLTAGEWSGIFWAGLLLLVTVTCLYAAVSSEEKRDEYICD